MQPIILALAMLLTGAIFAQPRDSLMRIAQNETDTSASLAWFELGKIAHRTSVDTAAIYFRKGADIAEALEFTRGKILNWRALGSTLGRLGQYDEALAVLGLGMELIKEENLPPINKVDFLINTGAVHYFGGFTGRALEPYIEAVAVAREHGFDAKRGMLLNNLGIFYRSLDRHEDAIAIYDEAYELRKSLADTAGMANITHNMAAAYGKIGDYEKALEAITESRKWYELLESEPDLLLNDLATGTFLLDLDRYDEARKYVMPLEKKGDLPFTLTHQTNLQIALGKIYQHDRQYAAGLRALSNVEEALLSSELSNEKAGFTELKANLLMGAGRHAEANRYWVQHRDILHANQQAEGQRLVKEMETKYLSQEKDHEIALLNSENEIAALKLRSAHIRNYGLGIGLLVFGILAFFLFRLLQKLKVQNALISEANQDKALLLKEIHHRVKNNLQVVSSLLGLQSRYVKDEAASQAIKAGRARVQSMSLLHQNVYGNENLKSVNIRKYFAELGESLFANYRMTEKDIAFKTNIEDLELDIDVVVPLGLITNELITNALKYAFEGRENGEILLEIHQKDHLLKLSVTDNGVGIPFSALPENANSLGMQLIKSFADKLEAEVQIENKGGTTFTLAFDPEALVLAAA